VNWLRRLYRNENNVDFPRQWRIALMVALGLMVLSVLALAVRNLNLGLDFEGGAAWDVPVDDADTADVRDVLEPFGLGDARIQTGSGLLSVRAEIDTGDARVAQITAALADYADVEADEVTTTVVGPSWGEEITNKAIRALIVFFIVVALYISFRLQWKMAAATLAAVAHDIVLTVGIYALFQFTVTPATVIAFLTIMGYSLYDTLVVFDRARENEHRLSGAGRHTYTEIMSLSLNQVLGRSINTSVASLLPVVSVLVVGHFILGGATLDEFAIALFVGLVTGALSSIYIAAPVAVWLKEREARWKAVRAKLAGRRGEPVARHDTAAVAAAAASATATATTAPGAASTVIPPRPRKQKRRS
jgi:preprotein translocase subunit SecF